MNLKSKKKTVCVIGAGVGGGILALELAKSGKFEVIVVDLDCLDKAFNHKESIFLESQCSGQAFKMDNIRGFGYGGTSNLWHGLITQLDHIDYEGLNELVDENISKEIKGYYKKVERYFPGAYALSNNNPIIRKSKNLLYKIFFEELGFTKKNFLLQTKPLRVRDLLSSVTKKSNHITCLKNAVAINIFQDIKSQSTAKGLVVSRINEIDGSVVKEIIYADYFVVSSGALESPRLILQSIKSGFKSINNKNIGKYLMDHPWTILGELKSLGGKLKFGFTDVFFRKSLRFRLGMLPYNKNSSNWLSYSNHCLVIKPFVFGNYLKFIEILKILLSMKINFNLLFRLFKKFTFKDVLNCFLYLLLEKTGIGVLSKKGLVFCYLEQKPNFDSSVSLTKSRDSHGRYIPNINWIISDADVNEALSINKKLINFFSSSKDVSYFPNVIDKNVFSSGCHHSGTLKMSRSSETGVVDKDLKIFGSDNIFVCDLSIFPKYGNSNPTLTLAAMSVRLSDHIISIG
jgi:hypothetical protein